MARSQVILLPGIVLPAELAYADLVHELGPNVDARAKELEIYAGDAPPQGYGLETEVEGIRRLADAAGFERFHLVGYSGGGASSIAFCQTYPERLITLTLNEPAWAGNEGLTLEEAGRWAVFNEIMEMPLDQMMPAFMRAQLRDDVPSPPQPEGPPPPWMAKRPAGIRAIIGAFKKYNLDLGRLRRFDRPVLFTLGGKSHPSYFAETAKRLATIFPKFRIEIFEERHHFDPPHRSEAARMAALLKELWDEAERR
jgi:pimeloyl-ACP methyl ester carboxylesterase